MGGERCGALRQWGRLAKPLDAPRKVSKCLLLLSPGVNPPSALHWRRPSWPGWGFCWRLKQTRNPEVRVLLERPRLLLFPPY